MGESRKDDINMKNPPKTMNLDKKKRDEMDINREAMTLTFKEIKTGIK